LQSLSICGIYYKKALFGEGVLNISVTGKHIPHDHEIRDFARSRVAALEKYYRQRITDAHVVVDSHHDYAEAEVRLHTNDGMVFVARDTGRDVWTAFDEAYEQVKRQLLKHKDIREKQRGGRGVV